MAVSTMLNRARMNITDAGISMATLAVLADLRPTTLSGVHRGVQMLDSVKEARLLTISFRLLELKQALAPLELPKEASDVAKILAQLEEGRISLGEIREYTGKMFESKQEPHVIDGG